MGDIAFPVGKADEERHLRVPGASSSFPGSEGKGLLCGQEQAASQLYLWSSCCADFEEEEETGLVLKKLVIKERRKLLTYCKPFAFTVAFEVEGTW